MVLDCGDCHYPPQLQQYQMQNMTIPEDFFDQLRDNIGDEIKPSSPQKFK